MSSDLNNFARTIRDDISAAAASAPDGHASQVEALTNIFIDDLSENGEIENGEVAHFQNGKMHVSGFGLSDAGDRLDLFLTIHTGEVPPKTIGASEVDRRFRPLFNFLQRAMDSGNPLYRSMSHNLPGRDMAQQIHDNRDTISTVRLHLFTDGLVKERALDSLQLGSLPVSLHVWDIQRLQRNQAHLQQPDPIVINLQSTYGVSLPCLEVTSSGQDYGACLTIFPGNILAQIYRDHGPRLLERNVRSFLQATGGINKGIRQTIREEPGRFLAYNNGISATASRVEFTTLAGGQRAITRIHDFQIVNGGQTTASLHRAMVKDRADLSQVHVQAKISVVDHQRMMEMVPLISRYANSQNKIEEADLAANDSFHVSLEQESKKVWTPAPTGVVQTHWFYERARGQYRDAEARLPTPARKKAFRKENPKDQKITKVDIARFINAWDGQPDTVSKGNQKNFAAFTVRMTSMGGAIVNRELFQRLVAMAILFGAATKMARAYPAYKANITTYTVAWLAARSAQRLDLDRIWREQAVPAGLLEVMQTVMTSVQHEINTQPDGANVTEWCKRPAAWQHISNLNIPDTAGLRDFMASEAISLLTAAPQAATPEPEDDAVEVEAPTAEPSSLVLMPFNQPPMEVAIE
ncbi:AIPR family protein [Deinococcus wulumuqiensis]